MSPSRRERALLAVHVADLGKRIQEHDRAREALDACRLPAAGQGACGAAHEVVHAHHMALVTLVDGQRTSLSLQRELFRVECADSTDTDITDPTFDEIEVGHGERSVRARGKMAWVVMILIAAVALTWILVQLSKTMRVDAGHSITAPAQVAR